MAETINRNKLAGTRTEATREASTTATTVAVLLAGRRLIRRGTSRSTGRAGRAQYNPRSVTDLRDERLKDWTAFGYYSSRIGIHEEAAIPPPGDPRPGKP
jgi:hypothetical protein